MYLPLMVELQLAELSNQTVEQQNIPLSARRPLQSMAIRQRFKQTGAHHGILHHSAHWVAMAP